VPHAAFVIRDGCSNDEFDLAALRNRLRKMSNKELLMYGVNYRYQCSPETSPDRSPLEALKLAGAREEWNLRFPRLPLRDSF